VIVVDTSVLVAIMLREPNQQRFHDLLLAEQAVMSAGTLVEVGLLAVAKGGMRAKAEVLGLVGDYGIEIVAVDSEQAELAIAGMLAFGKGRRRPPAVLNYGDLFSYALAKARDLPLLYQGDDFARTDVQPALNSG
jgi:ribonuclease VapC